MRNGKRARMNSILRRVVCRLRINGKNYIPIWVLLTRISQSLRVLYRERAWWYRRKFRPRKMLPKTLKLEILEIVVRLKKLFQTHLSHIKSIEGRLL